jgi:ABC-type lipoprotein release transport system permease subunit
VARLWVFLSRLFGLSNGRKREAELRAEIHAHIAGLYGVVSYAVRLIVGHGMLLTVVGLLTGLGGSWLLTPVLQSFLIDLPASDVVTFGAVAVTLVAIALAACYVPARRATRIDPIATLRAE